MSRDALSELARGVGLLEKWVDADGASHVVPRETQSALLGALGYAVGGTKQISESLRAFKEERRHAREIFVTAEAGSPIALPTGTPVGRGALISEAGQTTDVFVEKAGGGVAMPPCGHIGYHRLEIGDRSLGLAIAPPRAHTLEEAAPGRKLWGLTAQLYAMRRGPSRLGDFAALADMLEAAARQGADALAISPVHALFLADPVRYSPYAPSSRLFLNPLYASPELALEMPPAVGVEVSDEPALIDWREAAAGKFIELAAAYRAFQEGAFESTRADFEKFRKNGGRFLRDHARFEALHRHFFLNDGARDWRAWPQAYRQAGGAAVEDFAREHADAVQFQLFLQWLADRSLAVAQQRGIAAGMSIGIIADLAIGMDPGGSHAWSRPDELLSGADIGAPPDTFNRQGQNWGLTALSPRALRDMAFAPFLGTIRAALHRVGGLRIDHVLGMSRLWLIPKGAAATDGAYLSYPCEDMLRLLALESHRHRAILIGEDLGTVPDGLRDRLRQAGVMGMSVLWFERDPEGAFTPPEAWSPRRVALTTTHDLPTVAGWWRGRDLDWSERLHGPAPGGADSARRAREEDRAALWSACVAAGCAEGDAPPAEAQDAAVDAAIAFVGRSAASLVLLPIEDAVGLDEQPNIPGTVDEHPNWRRRLPADGETLMARPAVRRRLATLAAERSGK